MPNSNLENSKTSMKTRIRNRVQAGQTPRDLGRLAKSARFVGLLDDAEVETDIDTQMTAAIPAASVDELVEMSEGIAELRGGSADMGQVATTDNLTEGGNKFLKAENVQPQISVAGDLSYDNGVVSYTAPTAAALQVVATVGDLPLDATAGTQAVVTANNNLYIRTADGWYAVALINTAPTVSGNDATYELATDGTPTVITMTATDPENDPVTFSHSVTSGDLNGTTVSQSDNVFTVTPHASQPATFELTFSADDSVNVATSVSSFTLAFEADWSVTSQSPRHLEIINPNYGGPVSQRNLAAAATDEFGIGLALSGNIMAVGAPFDSGPGPDYSGQAGGVYIINTSTGAILHHIQHTDNAGNYYGDRFGNRIAMDGDNVLISAYEEDAGTGNWTNEGKVYLFSAASGSLIHTFDNPLTPYSGGESFGSSIGHTLAIQGNRAVVGFPKENSVYVYNVTSGNLEKTITPPTGFSWSNSDIGFGKAVAIDGDYVGIGAPNNSQFSTNGGSAHLFNLATDDWVPNRALYTHSSGRQDGDQFGISVAVGGGKFIVGQNSPQADASGHDSIGGRVSVWNIPTGSGQMESHAPAWSVDNKDVGNGATLGNQNNRHQDQLGSVVRTDGTHIVMGSYHHNGKEGMVYVYDMDGNFKTRRSNPNMSGVDETDKFGYDFAIDGGTLVVSAPEEHFTSSGDGNEAGAVYVWKA